MFQLKSAGDWIHVIPLGFFFVPGANGYQMGVQFLNSFCTPSKPSAPGLPFFDRELISLYAFWAQGSCIVHNLRKDRSAAIVFGLGGCCFSIVFGCFWSCLAISIVVVHDLKIMILRSHLYQEARNA